MVRLPHTLTYQTSGTPDYQDAEGYWVPGTPGQLVSVPCRAQKNGKGEIRTSQDGAQVVYNYLVYLPKGTASIPYGAQVQVYNGDTLLAEEKALDFHPGQLNCRLWV